MTDGTSQQNAAFFETFGYVVLPGLLADDIGWITDEFTEVFRDRKITHDPTKRTTVVPFIDQRERLCTLVEHPALNAAIAAVAGEDFNYLAGDGNYYTGDTHWHPDGEHYVGQYVKAALYLDPVTRDTGCLRVIPGSHRLNEPKWNARAASQSEDIWGVAQRDIPAIALESQPGDVVIFNHNLMHASFGGSSRRRMFTLNCGRRAESPEEWDELRSYILQHSHPWGDRVHSEVMRDTAGSERLRHLRQVFEAEEQLKQKA